MNNNLYIACVLYNKMISEIASFDVFLELSFNHDRVHFLVVDNSSEAYVRNNEIFAAGNEYIEYVSVGGNVGLSKAYNLAWKYIKKNISDATFMLIADDDTQFSAEYLYNVYSFCNAGGGDVCSGVIYDKNGKCISPNTDFDWLGRDKYAVKNPGHYKNIYCFNSGLCITTALLDTLGGFDENLFVDMVDYWLMDTLSAHGKNSIEILSGDIIQDFSASSYSNIESVVNRYKIYKKDFNEYCKSCNKSRLFKWFYGNRRRLNVMMHVIAKGRFDLLKEM